MQFQISFGEIIKIVKDKMKWILLCTLIFSAGSFLITKIIITPKYSAKTQLLVKLSNEDTNMLFDVNTNLLMINTYKDLITGDYIIDQVAKRLSDNYEDMKDSEQIRNSITISQSNNSQMFSIKSETASPKLSREIADLTAEVFQDEVKNLLKVEEAIIISKAKISNKPVSPNKKINVLIGALMGVLFGTLLSIIIELLDGTVKNLSTTDELGVPRLGVISLIER